LFFFSGRSVKFKSLDETSRLNRFQIQPCVIQRVTPVERKHSRSHDPPHSKPENHPSVSSSSSLCHLLVSTHFYSLLRRHTLQRTPFSMLFRTLSTQSDVAIVGAGPAGLSCAIAAANQGLQVELIDAMQPGIDKACGEGLMPGSLNALAALGFDLNRALSKIETAPLHGIRFIGDQTHPSTAEARFPAAPGRGIRRTILHQLLLDRAISLGVRFHWGNSVQSITQRSNSNLIRTNRQTLHARFLIGADGHQSRIAKWAGLEKSSTHSRRFGLRQHYAITPWTSLVEIYWSNHGQAYVTPISSTELCVAFVSNARFPTPADALKHFPALAHHLASAQPSGAPRGSITLGRTLSRVNTGSIALIGDASGSVDAITGEGMALCFRQATALALALKSNNLTTYQRAHRTIQRIPSLMSRSLLLMDRYPRLRTRTLTTFERNPKLFSRLLQTHIGHSPVQLFGFDGLLATGLHILTS
jgi:menaquinone-9 beta-reductase